MWRGPAPRAIRGAPPAQRALNVTPGSGVLNRCGNRGPKSNCLLALFAQAAPARAIQGREARMTRISRYILKIPLFGIVVTACPVIAQKNYTPGVTETEIKIGQTMPFSGPA